MKKIISILTTVVIIMSVLTSCGEKESLVGKYYYEDTTGINTEQYIEFSPDGNSDTLTLKNASGEGPLYTYNIDGEEIELTFTSFYGTESEKYSFSQKGNSIFFNGMKFTKK